MPVVRWLGPLLLLAHATAAAPQVSASPDYIVLLSVPFVSGSDQLGPLARARIDLAIPRLREDYGESPIELAGHSDGYGSAASNQELSSRRAHAVFEYLQANQVEMKFVFERAYGASEPIADNETRPGRFRNRRVELRQPRGPGPGDLSLP